MKYAFITLAISAIFMSLKIFFEVTFTLDKLDVLTSVLFYGSIIFIILKVLPKLWMRITAFIAMLIPVAYLSYILIIIMAFGEHTDIKQTWYKENYRIEYQERQGWAGPAYYSIEINKMYLWRSFERYVKTVSKKLAYNKPHNLIIEHDTIDITYCPSFNNIITCQ